MIVDGKRNRTPTRLANVKLRNVHTDRFPSAPPRLGRSHVLWREREQRIGGGEDGAPILGRQGGVHFRAESLAITRGSLPAIAFGRASRPQLRPL